MPSAPVYQRIVELLEGAGCAFEIIEHAAVSTAAEAAAARGTPLALGTKAILLKYDASFAIFALGAARALRSAKIRKTLGARRTRFATREELHAMTGLLPGSVPPFGPPVLPFPLFADPSALAGEELIFTAGTRTASIRLATADYRRVADPEVFDFTR